MMKRLILMALVVLMSSVVVAQDMITKEQFKEILQSTNISRNQVKQILFALCNTYKVKNREEKVEEYMSKQYDEDLFDCYYNVASKFLTVEDYKYFLEKKNNPIAISATEHQTLLKK